MKLIVILHESEWYPTKERRWTAQVDEETKFGDNIKKVITSYAYKDDIHIKCQDVEAVVVRCAPTLLKIPGNFIEFFQNMIALEITQCAIKTISREDLKGLEKLKEIGLTKMELRVLPSDLFSDLKRLEIIELQKNKLEIIGQKIFENLPKLKYVDLSDNLGINAIYVSEEYKNTRFPPPTVKFYKLSDFNAFLQIKCGMLQNFAKVMHTDSFQDFMIKVGQKKFHVHKIILAARSPTFAEFFKKFPGASEMIVEKIDEEIFEIILDFIYHDKVPTNMENSEKIFAAAAQLKLEKLKNFIVAMMIPTISKTNAEFFMALASFYECEELKAAAEEINLKT